LLFKRLIGVVFTLALAHICVEGALSTARWPEPIKYIAVATMPIAAGLFVWGMVIVWRILLQLRLKRLLIALGIVYVVVIAVSVLTSESSLPFHEQVWVTTKQMVVSVGRKTRDVVLALAGIPEEFRFAYTGHRRPILLPGMDAEDTSYLTPIPANRPARLEPGAQPTSTPARGSAAIREGTPTAPSAPDTPATPSPLPTTGATYTAVTTSTKGTPASLPLQPADCPHPLARLTVPRVNEVIGDEIQVEGSANI